MNLIPWRTKRDDEPAGQLLPVSGFRSEMDRLFDSFVRDAFGWGEAGLPAASTRWCRPWTSKKPIRKSTSAPRFPA